MTDRVLPSVAARAALYAFGLAGLANLLGEALAWRPLVLTSKPLLMPFLLLYLFAASWGRPLPQKGLLVMALVMATAGDVFLLFTEQGRLFFLLGLGAFLCTHLAYGYTFWRWTVASKPGASCVLYGGLALFYLAFNWGLRRGIPPDLRPAVAVYSLVILVMVVMAHRWRQVEGGRSGRWVLYGALLFLLSDSLLGWSKFGVAHWQLSGTRVWIMLTYLLGQYLLVRGAISRARE